MIHHTFLVVDTFICITILYYNREEHSSRVILVRSLCNDKSSLVPILFWVHKDPFWVRGPSALTRSTFLESGSQVPPGACQEGRGPSRPSDVGV